MLFALLIIKYAWVSDDAVITLRTIDNFLKGEAFLRWNIAERVQSYTHPLWLMILTPFFAITREYYLTLLVVSIVISLLTVFFLYKWSVNRLMFFILFPFLLYSIAFLDYTTSGLENPLSHLLVVVYIYFYFSKNVNYYKNATVLFLIASGLLLTRLDLAALVFPSLCLYLFRNRTVKHWVHAFAGTVPVLLWELFSLVYYGFLLPNTYYAKLNTGIETGEMIQQGLYYVIASLNKDPITMALIILGLFVVILKRDRRLIFLGVGVVLYFMSIVFAGGDYMIGRFLSALVVFVVAMLLFGNTFEEDVFVVPKNMFGIFAFVVIILCFLPLSKPILQVAPTREENRTLLNIGRESMEQYVFEGTRLATLNILKYKKWPVNNFLVDETVGQVKKGENVIVAGTIGHGGLAVGPEVHIIDYLGLADPLLARLPAKYNPNWRVGHYRREIPVGYIESVQTGKNVIEDKQLAEYYEHIKWITRGPIFAKKRLEAIYLVNTGKLDHLINPITYRYNPRHVNTDELARAEDRAIDFQQSLLVTISAGATNISGIQFAVTPVGNYYVALCENNEHCERQVVSFGETLNAPTVRVQNNGRLRNKHIKRVLLYPMDPNISDGYTVSNFEIF